MAEYIEREAAIKKMQELKRYAWAHPSRAEYRSTLDVNDVLFGLHYLPAADVVEVVALKTILSELESKCFGDGVENYTTGYRNGHRNGQIELLRHILQMPDGASEEVRMDHHPSNHRPSSNHTPPSRHLPSVRIQRL